ncbi:MAG: hypothetical protein AB1428_15090 [Bacteroidota bacterium]
MLGQGDGRRFAPLRIWVDEVEGLRRDGVASFYEEARRVGIETRRRPDLGGPAADSAPQPGTVPWRREACLV